MQIQRQIQIQKKRYVSEILFQSTFSSLSSLSSSLSSSSFQPLNNIKQQRSRNTNKLRDRSLVYLLNPLSSSCLSKCRSFSFSSSFSSFGYSSSSSSFTCTISNRAFSSFPIKSVSPFSSCVHVQSTALIEVFCSLSSPSYRSLLGSKCLLIKEEDPRMALNPLTSRAYGDSIELTASQEKMLGYVGK